MKKDPDDPSRFEFFRRMKQSEAERLERLETIEEKKRFVLRCASGGGMRHKSTKNPKVSLPKMSWEK